jgi:hypothetical protein
METLLSLANLLTCMVVALPLPRAGLWMRYGVPIALLIAVAQVRVEGPRWQMAPGYALAGLLCLAWLLHMIAPAGSFAGHTLAYRLAVGLGALGLVVAIALPIILPVFRFPPPSGPYAIGTLTYHWVDTDRPEIFSANPQARRELMVQIWYPAMGDPMAPRAPYMADADAVMAAFARIHAKSAFIFGHFTYVTTNAISSAPVAGDQPSYPLLLFVEGATGFRQMNTFQVEDLVSHGYIVAAVDQPGAAATVVFPDGHQVPGLTLDQLDLIRQSYRPAERAPTLKGQEFARGIVPYLAQDISFTLDQLAALNQVDPNGILTGRLDMSQIGAFGVSLGGIVVGEACLWESRLRACLMMDAPMPTDVVQAGLSQPSMWITRDAETMRLERQRAGGWPEEIAAHQATRRAVYQHLRGPGYFVQVAGMFHSNLMDIPNWSALRVHKGIISLHTAMWAMWSATDQSRSVSGAASCASARSASAASKAVLLRSILVTSSSTVPGSSVSSLIWLSSRYPL